MRNSQLFLRDAQDFFRYPLHIAGQQIEIMLGNGAKATCLISGQAIECLFPGHNLKRRDSLP